MVTIASLADRILPLLRDYGVARAGVFGSFARGEAGAASDLDLLVDLPEGATFFDLVGLEQDLTDRLGIKVDAHTYRSLHPTLRDGILRDEVKIL